MPFGLKNAPSKFQRFVNKILAYLISEIVVYTDDFLVATEAIEHLRLDGCKFLLTEIEYLGIKLHRKGLVLPNMV